MKKKYLYIFLTREGVTTLPNKSKEESDVYNMQYLGELETNEESEKNALN